jgi:hypothetical protein
MLKRKKLTTVLLVVLFLFFSIPISLTGQSQNLKEIRGTVGDKFTNAPIPDVSVIVKGTKRGNGDKC